jgi:hypothetical protein
VADTVAERATPQPIGAAPSQAPLTVQYEQLRQVALAGHAEGWRHGLGVLTTRGMTGWMNACRATAPAPAAAPTGGAGSHPLVEGAGELVAVMAAMALAHL